MLTDGKTFNLAVEMIGDFIGADCNANGSPDECDIADGASLDDNDNEIPDECDIASAIPAVSEWGMVIMALLVLTAATLRLARRRVATAPARQ